VATGLGGLQKNGQFIIQKDKFGSFLTVNKLQEETCELVCCQPKKFGMGHWFVKVGSKLGNKAAAQMGHNQRSEMI
jgi:hypothetical protein